MLRRIWLISISKFIDLLQPCELKILRSEKCETILDFVLLCSAQKLKIKKSLYKVLRPQLRAELSIFLRDSNLQPITANIVCKKKWTHKKVVNI
jgi:hypothetical protein